MILKKLFRHRHKFAKSNRDTSAAGPCYTTMHIGPACIDAVLPVVAGGAFHAKNAADFEPYILWLVVFALSRIVGLKLHVDGTSEADRHDCVEKGLL